MKRSLDGAPFNLIAADPEVRPWIGGCGAVDLSGIVSHVENFCFLTDCKAGGYIYVRLHPGLYEVHSLALPTARGRPMLATMRDSLMAMFTTTDCIEVVTKVPDGNVAASRWADLAGMRETFRRDAAFSLMGERVGVSFRSLHYADWVMKDPRNVVRGEAFHELIDVARLEAEVEPHPEDLVHNAWVGATLACAVDGDLHKAVGLYCRWAALAGYVQPQILTVTPPVVDIGDAVIQLAGGKVEILKVK